VRGRRRAGRVRGRGAGDTRRWFRRGGPDDGVGDRCAGLAGADTALTATYPTPGRRHNRMEPRRPWPDGTAASSPCTTTPSGRRCADGAGGGIRAAARPRRVVCRYAGGGLGAVLATVGTGVRQPAPLRLGPRVLRRPVSRGKELHPAMRAPSSCWLQVLWHCLTKRCPLTRPFTSSAATGPGRGHIASGVALPSRLITSLTSRRRRSAADFGNSPVGKAAWV
jgi:hypothetical protein